MKGTERQSIKKIEGFVCFVFLEILEVTSLSTRLLRQTLKTSFKAKKWGPLVFGEGFYINLSLANPIRFPNRIPGDLTVSNSRRKIYSNWIWLFSRAHSIGSIYLNKILTHKLGIKVGDWGGGHQWTSSLGNKSHPDWYLKIYQDEANLAVKEKAEKWKGVTPRPAKAEIMPGAIHNKDCESSYKGVCCLLMGNTCFFVQRNPLLIFWMYSRYWNKMTKEALWLLPDGPQSLALQVERGSVWSWVPNHHAYSDHQHSLFEHSAVCRPKCCQILRPCQSCEQLGRMQRRHSANTAQEHSQRPPVSSCRGRKWGRIGH